MNGRPKDAGEARGINPPVSPSSDPSVSHWRLPTTGARQQVHTRQPPGTESGWRMVQSISGGARQASLSPSFSTSLPQAHVTCIQPIFSTCSLLPLRLFSPPPSSGVLTPASPGSSPLTHSCPQASVFLLKPFLSPHIVLQPLSRLNAQLATQSLGNPLFYKLIVHWQPVVDTLTSQPTEIWLLP